MDSAIHGGEKTVRGEGAHREEYLRTKRGGGK